VSTEGVGVAAPAAGDDGLPSLRRYASLREEVAGALRAALVAGQMVPGRVYSAPALAARFGVSPTPVREAMLDLAKEGLVEVVRNKGFRVTELSERDLDEITELRALIEVPSVARLYGRVTVDDLERLRPLATTIVDAAREGDLIAYVEADRRFHLGLLELGGNSRIVETVGELRMRSRLFGLSRLAERGQLVPTAEEHVGLLDLLATGTGGSGAGVGDGAGAGAVAELMRQHLSHVRGIWAHGWSLARDTSDNSTQPPELHDQE
jgi:DNA-binding GntR family transcriptional regulator